MAKKMLIDATHPEETRVVVVDGNKVDDFDFESQQKRQLAGNIYLAKVIRVEPSLQAAFVDYGGNRHGFLAFPEIHPDYYQIPVADKKELLEQEKAYAERQAALEEQRGERARRKSEKTETSGMADATTTQELDASVVGMETIDIAPLSEDEQSAPPQSAEATDDLQEPAQTAQEQGAATAEDADTPPNEATEDIQIATPEDDLEDIPYMPKPSLKKYKIQEVINVRQIMLIQVVKEERGNKGAALTTYLSLAGRYCVLMPNTARGGGISRKITNISDRKKIKEIAVNLKIPEGAGLIVRTAGAKRTKTEIKRDYEYLQRLWDQIREITIKSIAPCPIYEEGDLIKRSIRDLYNRDIGEVLVEGEAGYRAAKDTMKMILPSHAKNVNEYSGGLPIFARYKVEEQLENMFNPTVQLKSGGYIVIGVTEALVAIDVNSGRATKEGSIEQTALNTNLEAAEEVARQLRLRDLAGLIVIDFIDMEERRNNTAVQNRLKEKLKNDRARVQIGAISNFGLLEMSRQRLRPGMLEITTQHCAHCHGTGLVRSDNSLGLTILREIEEEVIRGRTREVLIKAPVGIVNFLINSKRERIAQIEERSGISVRLEADALLISPEYSIEKFKNATRFVAPSVAMVNSINVDLMKEIDESVAEDSEPEEESGVEAPARKRRRRRRGRGKAGQEAQTQVETQQNDPQEDVSVVEAESEGEESAAQAEPNEKPKRTRKPRRKKEETAAEAEGAQVEAMQVVEAKEEAAPSEEASQEKPKKTRVRKTKAKVEAEEQAPADEPSEGDEKPKKRKRAVNKKQTETAHEQSESETEAAALAPNPESDPAATPASEPAEQKAPPKPRRLGWWSRG